MATISQIIDYIDAENNRLIDRDKVDDFGGYVGDALCFSNTEARSLMAILDDIERRPGRVNDPYFQLADLIYEKIHNEYGDKAKAFAQERVQRDRYENDVDHGKRTFSDRDPATGIRKHGPI